MKAVPAGSTSQTTQLRIVGNDGKALPGVIVDGNLTLWYARDRGLPIVVAGVNIAADAPYTVGGFAEIRDGYYRFDPPNAAYLAGAEGVLFGGTKVNGTVIGSYHDITGPPLTGAGANQVTIQLGEPDVDVWITSDAQGSQIVAGTRQTDSAGDVLFLLDAGNTYYLWAQKDGFNSILGQQFVAVAD